MKKEEEKLIKAYFKNRKMFRIGKNSFEVIDNQIVLEEYKRAIKLIEDERRRLGEQK